LVGIFIFFLLPETKGLSLEDMSVYFAELTGDTSLLEAEKNIIAQRSAGGATMEMTPSAGGATKNGELA